VARGPAFGAVSENTIRVEGLADLQRAFRLADKALGKGVREALEAAGDPVRFEAEQLASTNPSGMVRNQIAWEKMRVGITKSTVYVAPVERGVKSKGREKRRRENLKTELLDRALDPALAHNVGRVEHEVIDTLEDLAKAWARV
jgi:hypothetical protein